MNRFYSVAALVTLPLAGCADQGATSRLLAPEQGSRVSTQSPHVDGLRSIDVPGALATRAYGINAAGEIVGSYTDATGTYGYLWTDGNVTKIQFPGTIFTEAWGINPQGDIVGRYRRAGVAGLFGFMLSDGVFTDISVPGHLNTLPTKINATRDIAGCFHDTNFLVDMRGYLQRGDRVTSDPGPRNQRAAGWPERPQHKIPSLDLPP
jgi:probable HAF family extracellular repeat protein